MATPRKTVPVPTPAATRRTLYPEIEPYRSGWLRVSPDHEIYWEESGNPQGKPAVFVHGGPGAGADARSRRFFDPRKYRIVVFDQRGCGRSRPHASLVDNTTWHLVADMEQLRKHLGIERWLVFGGSWGSTLSLAYAQTHPRARHRARAARHLHAARLGDPLVLPARRELDLSGPVGELRRGDPEGGARRPGERVLQAAHQPQPGDAAEGRQGLGGLGRCDQLPAASNESTSPSWNADDFAIAVARIECHYFVNQGFFEREDQLLRGVRRIRTSRR